MADSRRIAILGDGAWGTAMALALCSSGHSVRMWGHDPDYLDAMRRTRLNQLFLPDYELPAEMEFEPDIAAAVSWADLTISAVPSKFIRNVFAGGHEYYPPEKPVVSLTKGLEPESFRRPSEIIRECLGARHVAALSGPSHAEEVAQSLPASVVVASHDLGVARAAQHIISTPRFRVYASKDLVGVEIAGAGKNVIALAAGVAVGMDLGNNALSALITRGLAEISRVGCALGGDAPTFAGLAGMGDLITTCYSPYGRNRAVGMRLAEGESLQEILEDIPGVPEGVTTADSLLALAVKHDIPMPITEQVASILWEGKNPETALNELMTRAKKDED
ncbi:MAG: NAD(P)-dependent glycerol-3-phosphate dehydrogenase [Planctomycetota bacterium]|jgi:glycerol-3-phosphate dehydrogenase (NAD(P)+)|nr:NAD(P)-dependent glycerol-3-phosphate dehydrogenase [Planctomycetota bacterium]